MKSRDYHKRELDAVRNVSGKAVSSMKGAVEPSPVGPEDLNAPKPAQYVECKDKGGDMENGFVTECYWHNCSLEEAYVFFKEKNKDNDDGKYLENNMPESKMQKDFEAAQVNVQYQFTNQGKLSIALGFPGGSTHYSF